MAESTAIWTAKNIKTPHKNDILLGRGGGAIHNDANVRYRTMVRVHKKAYQTYTRLQKTQLAESLVREWQIQNPPGRFLELDAKTSTWFCISEKSARRKTSQLLREGAPKIRRQIKAESTSAAASPMTTVSTVATSATENTAPPVNTSSPQKAASHRPSRTPASKMAMAKLKARNAADSSLPVNITPQRHMEYETRTPFSPNPSETRMVTPSPNSFSSPPPPSRENWPAQPPRWQWSPYYGSANPYPYYPPAPPAPTPLRSITSADANRGPTTKAAMAPSKPATVQREYSISKPFETPRPALVERKYSISAPSPESVVEFMTPKPANTERRFSVASPESVLDFGSIIELPISSWDEDSPESSGEVSLSSLVEEEANQMEPAVLAVDVDDIKLPDLEGGDYYDYDDPTPPPALDFRKDSSNKSLFDTLQGNFSFDSFERMESLLVDSDEFGSSTMDILNELDQELENEFLLRPCHSL